VKQEVCVGTPETFLLIDELDLVANEKTETEADRTETPGISPPRSRLKKGSPFSPSALERGVRGGGGVHSSADSEETETTPSRLEGVVLEVGPLLFCKSFRSELKVRTLEFLEVCLKL
jgi:hypothetical protein